MSKPKKSFFDSVKGAIMESDAPDAPAQPTPAPAPVPDFSSIPAFAAQPHSSAAVSAPTPVVHQVDEQALKLYRDGVYVDVSGRPSRFIKFLQMYEAVGRNVATALGALKVADPTITAQSILDDIGQHESLLDNLSRKALQEFESAQQQTVGKTDEEAQRIRDQNKAGEALIAQTHKEMQDRTLRLQELEKARAQQEEALQRARAKTAAAETIVRTELQSMKQTLSAS